MKSPVPFIKPKSYYTSPIKPNVIRDTITPQINPILQSPSTPQDIVKVEHQDDIVEEKEILKLKKPKQTLTIPKT